MREGLRDALRALWGRVREWSGDSAYESLLFIKFCITLALRHRRDLECRLDGLQLSLGKRREAARIAGIEQDEQEQGNNNDENALPMNASLAGM